MSAIRQVNWLGQQRVDVFHVRALESSVAADFDCLAGMIMAGGVPLVVRGLTIPTTGTLGQRATNLVLRVADSVFMHPTATDSGTIFFAESTAADEVLAATNANVSGSFAASATNYISLDLVREADATTSDLTAFLDPNTEDEINKDVPVGRVMQIQIVISTLPFSSTENSLPIAKVVTDASGNVVSITDARNLFPRLGTGGDVPNSNAGYSWPDATRKENPITYSSISTLDPFAGGDKGIYSTKSIFSALQHIAWEAKSGEHWYSRTTRDGVKFAMNSAPVFGNGDNFTWDAGTNTLSWTGLSILFENSSGGFKNLITDGSAVILDGQCIYVDLDRTTTPTPSLVPAVATLTAVAAPTLPGSRFILAWRTGPDIQIRDRPFDLIRLQNIFSVVAKRYPNVYVSSVIGEGDATTLAAGIALLPAYGGVLIIQSDLTMAASVTIPANVKVLARRGVTLTLSGVGTELILSDRTVVEDLRISSTKTSGVLGRSTGFKTAWYNCRFDVAPAGTATGLQIDGNACSVNTCEFTGVVAPSTGTGIATAVGAQDYYISGDNVFGQ